MSKNISLKAFGLTVTAVVLAGLIAIVLSEYSSSHPPQYMSWRGFGAWLYPLVGLIGLVMLWGVTMLGALSGLLMRDWPRFLNFHRGLALAVLTVALAGPTLQAVALGLVPTIRFDTVAADLIPYALLAPLSTVLLAAYVGLTALAEKPAVARHWNLVQTAVYAALTLGLVHARVMSTEFSRWPGTWIWYGLAVSFGLLASWRLFSDDDDDDAPTEPPPTP